MSAAPYRTRFFRHDSPHRPRDRRHRAAPPRRSGCVAELRGHAGSAFEDRHVSLDQCVGLLPPFPPVGPGSAQFPTFPGTRRVVRLLPAHPGRLRSPSTARYLSVDACSFPLARASIPSRGRTLCGQARHACLAGGDGRPSRFRGNSCESGPRARASGGSQRPRAIGRPDTAFRQAHGVGLRHGKRFRSCILAARFLAAYASPPPRPQVFEAEPSGF